VRKRRPNDVTPAPATLRRPLIQRITHSALGSPVSASPSERSHSSRRARARNRQIKRKEGNQARILQRTPPRPANRPRSVISDPARVVADGRRRGNLQCSRSTRSPSDSVVRSCRLRAVGAEGAENEGVGRRVGAASNSGERTRTPATGLTSSRALALAEGSGSSKCSRANSNNREGTRVVGFARGREGLPEDRRAAECRKSPPRRALASSESSITASVAAATSSLPRGPESEGRMRAIERSLEAGMHVRRGARRGVGGHVLLRKQTRRL